MHKNDFLSLFPKTFLVLGMISQVDSLGFTFLSSGLIFWVYFVNFFQEEFCIKKFTLTFQNFVFSVSGSVSPVDSSTVALFWLIVIVYAA